MENTVNNRLVFAREELYYKLKQYKEYSFINKSLDIKSKIKAKTYRNKEEMPDLRRDKNDLHK